MAVDDVFRVRMIGETREGEFSLNMHYQELTAASLAISSEALAEALSDQLTPEVIACMATSASVSRWVVDKLSGTRHPGSTFSEVAASRVGTFGPNALPANTAIKFNFGQILFAAKSNGRVWLSGIPTTGVLGSVVTAAYRDGVIASLAAALLTNITEVSAGDGLWRLVVVSQKWLDANPGDYVGAAADVVTVQADPRVAMMRSRTFGGRRRLPAPVPV